MEFDWLKGASRRGFLRGTSRTSILALLGVPLIDESGASELPSAGDYDLSWAKQLEKATDRAVIDMPSPGDFGLQLAARILDNCDAAYGAGKHRARVVLNIRTRAIAMALNDAMWTKYSLGADVGIKGRDGSAATFSDRNPFLELPAGQGPEYGGMNDLVKRGSIAIVCDFAMGHTATRLAGKLKLDRADVHRELKANLVPNAFMVPSGMFGLMKSQNLGCAFVSGGG